MDRFEQKSDSMKRFRQHCHSLTVSTKLLQLKSAWVQLRGFVNNPRTALIQKRSKVLGKSSSGLLNRSSALSHLHPWKHQPLFSLYSTHSDGSWKCFSRWLCVQLLKGTWFYKPQSLLTVYPIFFFYGSIFRKQNGCYIQSLFIWIARWFTVYTVARAKSKQLFLMLFKLWWINSAKVQGPTQTVLQM